MPSRIQIAEYWIRFEVEQRKVAPFGDWDWSEPSCMACGIWRDTWDEPVRETRHRDRVHQLARRWGKTDLERCHVVTRYLGGSDHFSNLALLCGDCHRAQPDTSSADEGWAWIRHRTLVDRSASFKELLDIDWERYTREINRRGVQS